MKRIIPTAPAVFALCAVIGRAPAPASAQSPTIPAIISRMVAAENIQSYTASVRADIAMHSFPFLSPTLEGTYYHKEPSKNKIVFTSGLPFIAKQFSKVYPEVESPANWQQKYFVSMENQDGAYTTLK